jgi:hypothetical protein
MDDNVNMDNILYFAYSGGAPSAADCDTIAAGIGTAWNTNLAAYLSGSGLLETVTVQDLASSSGAESTHTVSHAGTRSGNVPTLAACVIMSHHIARRYRGGKPRSYLPYLVTADLTGASVWGATPIGNLNSAWAAFITACAAVTGGSTAVGAHVNVSYFHGFTVVTNPVTHRARNVPTPRATPVVDTVTTSVARRLMGSQRRRIVP